MKKIIFNSITLLLCMIVSLQVISAQSLRTVTGVVKDKAGAAIPGASVILENDSKSGAVTDIDGKFTLKIPATSPKTVKLVVSCLSY